MSFSERELEQEFIEKLKSLKYEYRPDIDDREKLKRNFREKFETLNRMSLTDETFARLLKDNPDIEKCLFVVDRKDLDRQTRKEFNKFQENCIEENANTPTKRRSRKRRQQTLLKCVNPAFTIFSSN